MKLCSSTLAPRTSSRKARMDRDETPRASGWARVKPSAGTVVDAGFVQEQPGASDMAEPPMTRLQNPRLERVIRAFLHYLFTRRRTISAHKKGGRHVHPDPDRDCRRSCRGPARGAAIPAWPGLPPRSLCFHARSWPHLDRPYHRQVATGRCPGGYV